MQLGPPGVTQPLRGRDDRIDPDGRESALLDEAAKFGQGARIAVYDLRAKALQPAVVLAHQVLVHHRAGQRFLAAGIAADPTLEPLARAARWQVLMNAPD